MKYKIGDVIKFKKDGVRIQDHFELISEYRLVGFVGKVIRSIDRPVGFTMIFDSFFLSSTELMHPRNNAPKQKAQLSLYSSREYKKKTMRLL